MMQYKISHNTTYEYADLVPVCQNVTHLVPRQSARQRCTYHRLIVKPAPRTGAGGVRAGLLLAVSADC